MFRRFVSFVDIQGKLIFFFGGFLFSCCWIYKEKIKKNRDTFERKSDKKGGFTSHIEVSVNIGHILRYFSTIFLNFKKKKFNQK